MNIYLKNKLKRYLRLRYFFQMVFYLLFDWTILLFRKQSSRPGNLLIVKTDAIGDYILFRNFLKNIRESERFRNYHITFCGNKICAPLAVYLDTPYVNKFIWVDRNRLLNDWSYRKDFFMELRQSHYEVAVNPVYSREFLISDSIIRQADAEKKIGSTGDCSIDFLLFKFIADRWYNKQIDTTGNIIFEFNRNKEFVTDFLDEEIELSVPVLPFDHTKPKQRHVIIAPGAGEQRKKWPVSKFAEVADWILKETGMEIKICGGPDDKLIAEEMIALAKPDSQIRNLCGETTLNEMIDVIGNAELLITNDSSALHFAAGVKTKTVCISNGRHYGRFTPYPSGMGLPMKFVFPPRMQDLINKDESEAKERTRISEISDIADISSTEVIEAIKALLNESPAH